MSFNALSLAKLGIGFGALAVASIGLLSPAPVEIPTTLNAGVYLQPPPKMRQPRENDEAFLIALLL